MERAGVSRLPERPLGVRNRSARNGALLHLTSTDFAETLANDPDLPTL